MPVDVVDAVVVFVVFYFYCTVCFVRCAVCVRREVCFSFQNEKKSTRDKEIIINSRSGNSSSIISSSRGRCIPTLNSNPHLSIAHYGLLAGDTSQLLSLLHT